MRLSNLCEQRWGPVASDRSRALFPAFILYTNRFQISRKNVCFASLFAHDYAEYCHGEAMALGIRNSLQGR